MAELIKQFEKKISGPTLKGIYDKILVIHGIMLNIEDSASFDISTLYIKYQIGSKALSPVFAVLWIQPAKNATLGLATKYKIMHEKLVCAPKKMRYKGLTSYLRVTENETLPDELDQWAKLAFENIKQQTVIN